MRDAARLPNSRMEEIWEAMPPYVRQRDRGRSQPSRAGPCHTASSKDAAHDEAYKAGTFDVEALKTNGVKLLLG
jgi:hypothetical protein